MSTYDIKVPMPVICSTLICIPVRILGTAIYVFFTLVDNPDAYVPGITTATAVNFTIDDMTFPPFAYNPRKEEAYLFRSLVFAQNTLPDGNHTLLISGPANGNESVYINFDYAIYT